MEFYQVKSGDYSVEIDLKKLFGEDPDQLNSFSRHYQAIAAKDEDFKALSSLRDGFLRYQSETVLPLVEDDFKPKILIVYGNPATHSVKHGMFFFSKGGDNFYRSGMWGKLANAALVSKLKSCIKDHYRCRQQEANVRKLMILTGKSSPDYRVGLTTFYSLPTPASGSHYSGVAGVEKLFNPVLDKIAEAEVNRIQSYPFAQGATIVFTQKSSYEMYCKLTGTKPDFWPIKGKGSGGDSLAKLLSVKHPIPSKKEQWAKGE